MIIFLCNTLQSGTPLAISAYLGSNSTVFDHNNVRQYDNTYLHIWLIPYKVWWDAYDIGALQAMIRGLVKLNNWKKLENIGLARPHPPTPLSNFETSTKTHTHKNTKNPHSKNTIWGLTHFEFFLDILICFGTLRYFTFWLTTHLWCMTL